MKHYVLLAALLPAVFATATASAAPAANGEKIYQATCMACHGTGVMGAPKVGDAAAWKPRVAQGMNTLYANATKGFKMMPPRGGNPGLKDDEVKAAIDFMVGRSK